MNNRINQNRAQRPSKRAKFKENNRQVIYPTNKETVQSDIKSIPEKEQARLIKQIRERAFSKRRKERLIFGIILLFGTIAFIKLMVSLN